MKTPAGTILMAATQILCARCDWGETSEINFPPIGKKNRFREEMVKESVSLAMMLARESERRLAQEEL
jgi:hypothetical protein